MNVIVKGRKMKERKDGDVKDGRGRVKKGWAGDVGYKIWKTKERR